MIADLFRFLGLDDGFVPDMSVRHRVGGIPRSTGLRRAMERETSLIRHLARAVIRCGRESKRRSIAGTQYVHRCRTTCDGS
jgi:hypothetical protein